MRVPSPLSLETEALVTRVIGCAMAVHRELGPGLLEGVYRRAMSVELRAQGIPFETEKAVAVRYRGVAVPGQRIDLIVDNQVIVELKAVKEFDPVHVAQLLSYLRTTGLRVGLLINFHKRLLRYGLRRVVL
jgi:GxxExxY protein